MWFRVDDKFPDHPKTDGLSAQAMAVWLCCGCYCGEYETDGYIPRQRAWAIAARFDPQASLLADEPASCSQLVRANLMTRVSNGYEMHDFLDWNPSKKVLNKKRRLARKRMQDTRRKPHPERIPRPSTVRANISRSARKLTGSRPDPTHSSTSSAVVVLGIQAFEVHDVLLLRWRTAFPNVDVSGELRKAFEWAQTHPAKANWQRFLVNWLKRAPETAPSALLNGADVPHRIRPAILDLPALTDDQLAENHRRAKAMVSSALDKLPKVPS